MNQKNSRKPQKTVNTALKALTSIRDAYTLAATNEGETSEVDLLIIRHFLEVMAEVALSIASRKIKQGL